MSLTLAVIKPDAFSRASSIEARLRAANFAVLARATITLNRLVEPLPSSKQAKEYVAETLTPALTAGLVALCRAKPTNPAEFLAHYLLENNRRAA